ncbi:MAG: sigma-70 family RNA polymerase sigma factor [Planctomycetes bacterium]|nr:sigma-70 family RNA polymerase sigma factor [Planctomycetota bacterium]
MTPPTSEPDLLLADLAWTRRLARTLVRDAATADDVAQEAWLAARQGARGGRAWLAGVVRNLVRQARRADVRRAARELDAAAPEAREGADELVARAELQQRLVAAVLALDEPYRSTVLRRHFGGESVRAIAAAEGVVAATVESRLTRAHAQLRARLERELGGTAPASILWLAVDVSAWPWIGNASGLGGGARLGTQIGVLLVKAKVLVVCAVLAAVGGWWWLERSDSEGGAPSDAPATAEPAEPADAPGRADGAALASAPVAEARTEAFTGVLPGALRAPERPAPLADSTTAAAANTYAVTGHVIDAEGRAVGGVELALEGAQSARCLSSADGGFSLVANAPSGRARVVDARWAEVRAGVWQRHSRHEPLVVVAPPLVLSGRVEEEHGESLANARVSYRLPESFEARFVDVLEGSEPPTFATASARDGTFELTRVPAVAGARLRAVLDGYTAASLDAPTADASGLVLTLSRPTAALAGALRGRVVDGEGRGVAAARVACGLASTKSASDGTFELDLARAVTADAVTAAKAGFLPDRVERPGGAWPSSVTLRLSRPTLSLAGRVVDAAAKPLEGVKVWVADPTPFGVIGSFPAPLEGLLAGAEIPAQVFEGPEPDSDGDVFNDYWMRVGPPSAFWHWVETDEEGRFRIDGLLDRDYRLSVLSSEPLALATSDPFAAGRDDVQVVLPLGERWPRFRGRVLDDRGRPLADVRVRERMNVVDTTGRVYGGRVQVVLYQQGQRVETDADGWFELEDVPKHGVALDFQGDHVLPAAAVLGPDDDPAAWSVVVHARCNFQVELAPTRDRGDRLEALDGDGNVLDLLLIRGGSVNAFTAVDVEGGRTPVISVSSAARTLVLYDGDVEVARMPVALEPNRVTTVVF